MPSRVVFLAVLVGTASCGGRTPTNAPEQPPAVQGTGPEQPPASVAEELKRLEGEWKMVRAEPDELKQSGRAVFKGDTVTFREGDPPLRFRIDPTREPKWMDVHDEFFKIDMPGIYKLEGDRLTLYLITEFESDKPAERPRRFDEKCPGQILHFERAKKAP
jgi:uncharacterized protein (TIGR03067 family)